MRQCIMWSGCAYFPLDAGHQGRKTESASVSREHHPYTEAERAPPNINVREGQRPPTRVESTSAGSSRQEGRKRVGEIRGKKKDNKKRRRSFSEPELAYVLRTPYTRGQLISGDEGNANGGGASALVLLRQVVLAVSLAVFVSFSTSRPGARKGGHFLCSGQVFGKHAANLNPKKAILTRENKLTIVQFLMFKIALSASAAKRSRSRMQ